MLAERVVRSLRDACLHWSDPEESEKEEAERKSEVKIKK